MSSKKTKIHIFENIEKYRDMKCAVCHNCHEVRNEKGVWTGTCVYGGPYTGYIEVNE
jgi:hypothetical protein